MTKADAEAIAAWRYRGRYSTYDVGEIVTSARGSVAHETELVGYCCFGPEARVPGIDEEEGTTEALGFEHDGIAPSAEGDFLVMTRPGS